MAAGEGGNVEPLGRAAFLALDQRRAQPRQIRAALLLTADQVADCLAVIGLMAGIDLRGDPVVLLLGQRDGLAHDRHVPASSNHIIGAI